MDLSSIGQSLPSPEEMDRQLAGIRERRRLERQNPSPELQAMQAVTSLRRWLDICQQAGISAIPATFSPSISAEDIEGALDGDPSSLDNVSHMEAWLSKHLQPGHMWRWDVCGPMELKADMDFHGTHTATPSIGLDDPRFFDICYELNRPTMELAVRPWVKATYSGTHPVEFRAYVFAEGEPAVSNYYPQRPLSDDWLPIVEQVQALAVQLRRFSPHKAFTSDFLIADNGDILFLEGGPAWGQGAHPCCFESDISALLPGAVALS